MLARSGQWDSAMKEDGIEESQDGEEGAAWNDVDVIRHVELYFALCSKKPDFLLE
jgi:hypothetical protein